MYFMFGSRGVRGGVPTASLAVRDDDERDRAGWTPPEKYLPQRIESACGRSGAPLTYNHMVVQTTTEADADRVFHALSDATRRDIIARVIRHEESVTGLAAHYPMSFAAVQKHVAVLERASLVTKQRRGREQIVRADMSAIRRASRLLDAYEEIWRHRVAQMESILAEEGTTEP
ncbi:ArsR/SmtB family transcription factor [Micromonosporaceae bacterium DT55]|uniref:ArsR/SmtB family transcription factor n=1 Tax=Melissospora conviva TaxID=3388432 RepID=UPI003C283151